jgi:hypothetical protein
LTLRAAQGFLQSLRELAFADLPVPNYTTLSRRAQELQVTLPEMSNGEPVHLVVDSTGVKLYGEGEWKVRKHGYSKRRTWRKVHLGLDVKTGQVRAALMTHQDVDDASALSGLLAQIPADEPIDTIGGDGAYNTKDCHAEIAGRDATPSIPPREKRSPGLRAVALSIQIGTISSPLLLRRLGSESRKPALPRRARTRQRRAHGLPARIEAGRERQLCRNPPTPGETL